MHTDRWPDDVRLSDLEPQFRCTVYGLEGADVRPLFEEAEPLGQSREKLKFFPNNLHSETNIPFMKGLACARYRAARKAVARRPGLLPTSSGIGVITKHYLDSISVLSSVTLMSLLIQSSKGRAI
jgi:hypothetical protein